MKELGPTLLHPRRGRGMKKTISAINVLTYRLCPSQGAMRIQDFIRQHHSDPSL